jgi:hypothetical protein
MKEEERNPADEIAFMWNVDKLAQLEKECEKENSRGPVPLDGINFVRSYARALLIYFKSLCRTK